MRNKTIKLNSISIVSSLYMPSLKRRQDSKLTFVALVIRI